MLPKQSCLTRQHDAPPIPYMERDAGFPSNSSAGQEMNERSWQRASIVSRMTVQQCLQCPQQIANRCGTAISYQDHRGVEQLEHQALM